jgi:hypothetical protein
MSSAEKKDAMRQDLIVASVATIGVVVFFLWLGLRLEWHGAGWEAATALSTIALACITATGFLFLRRQLIESRDSLKTQTDAIESQTRWQVYQLSFDAYRIFIDSPELYPYFYRGKPAPDDEQMHDRLRATAELMLDYFEGIVLSKGNLAAPTRDLWKGYMAELYGSSPVLREFWLEKRGRYANELGDAMLPQPRRD